MTTKGTPKNLHDALENALQTAVLSGAGLEESVEILQLHLRDFLAQRFGVARLFSDDYKVDFVLRELWKGITGEEIK